MARYYEVHPHDPQQRMLAKITDLLRQDALIAYPADSGFMLGCRLDSPTGAERMRTIRHLDDRHHFTLICSDIAQASRFVQLDNPVFRAFKAVTPGPYTFIVPATNEVPRRMSHPKKRTVGIRIPDNRVALAILADLGEPLLSSTLILPGQEDPLTEAWIVQDEIGNDVDVIVDAGETGRDPTTVVDWTSGHPEVLRVGAGDPTPFQ